MAHKRRIHAAFSIELLFEGKDHQRLVDVIPQQTYAPLPPGPELRRYVINRWDVASLHLSRHPPVERRRIDHDGEIRLAPIGLADEVLIKSEDLRQVTQDLGDADHREISSIHDGLAPGCAHAVSANAEELKLRVKAMQRFDQLRAVHFAGRLPGGDQDSHAAIVIGYSNRPHSPWIPVSANCPSQFPDPCTAADRACSKCRDALVTPGACPSHGPAPCASR